MFIIMVFTNVKRNLKQQKFVLIHVFMLYLRHEQYVTQGQFFDRIQLFWIQFSFARILSLPRLKNLAFPNIEP